MKLLSVLLAFFLFFSVACNKDTKKKTVNKDIDPKPLDTSSTHLPEIVLTDTLKKETVVVKKDKKRWFIIGGSFKQFKNAEKLYMKLTKTGYESSQILDEASAFNRVVLSSYMDSTQARTELKRMRAIRGDNTIWLLEGK